MSLTNFGILFSVFAICIFLNVGIRQNLLEEQIYGNVMVNNIVDNITQDALRQSFYFDGNRLDIDREKLLRFVTEEMAQEYMAENKGYAKYLQKNIKMIILAFPDGFYLGSNQAEEFVWEEKQMFPEGKMTPKEEKANMVVEAAENYGVTLYLPNGEKTGLVNDMGEYQLFLVYESYPYTWMGKTYQKVILSGAKVNYHMIFHRE